MDYQLSAEAERVVSKPSLTFLLVESQSPIRLDLELMLRKRFPTAFLERLFPEADVNALKCLVWEAYDLVIIATEKMTSELSWLHGIQRTRAGLPIVIVLTDDQNRGREAVWAGADLSLPLQASPSQLATQLDNLLEVGRALQRYPINLPQWHFQELIHNSENSVIFLAENRHHRQAVIKRFKFDVSGVENHAFGSFLQDAKLLTALQYPGLVHLLDVGVSCNAVVIIMEYVQGQTLRALLTQHAHLLLTDLISWFKQITESLGVIHSLGMLHRDLKASNIVMNDDSTPVLLDYGIESSVMLSSGFLQEDQIYCTPFYVSPERVAGDPASIQSDLYALGILLYEMLVGEKPYTGSDLGEVLQKQLFDPLPQLPKNLIAYQPLLNRLLAKLPEQRPASAEVVLTWFSEQGF
ncbi:serine/threonine-protein kinase [uncultured Thiothrix sp.]|uniref:serine/threonine-protein kinase n=1 Tax=uncultured Thiothrix sp. TaxID=223185 RepID=UPI002618385C|nr:serine/threonine-protein kinase [uncultured Thiothrix sp.]